MTTTTTPLEAADQYATWILRTGYSENTKKGYPPKVRAFLKWVEAAGDEYHDALTSEHGRDYAVRDYREKLLTVDKKAPATVEAAMSALANFYDTYLQKGKPRVPRQNPGRDDVRGLEPKQIKAVLRAAERRGVRDFALTMLMFGCGLRVAELAALDTDDLFIAEREGWVDVRHGKGGASRRVPVPPDVRRAVKPWLAQRAEQYGREIGPLFMSRRRGRLSIRRMQSLMDALGREAGGVDLSPHTLRHTFAVKYLEDGGLLSQLQRVLGHKNLSSTQVYVRPSNATLADFAERQRFEF